MVTVVPRKFEDFDFGVDIQVLRKFVPSQQCHQFVPYTDVEAAVIPKIMDITHLEKRVYLKPQPKKSVATNRRELESVTKGFDSKRVLDLGVAPLQRIINEMKSVSSGTADEGPDRSAVARASGLAGYCAYLKGGSDRYEPKAHSPRALRNTKNPNTWSTF
ncbi:hypothetical protein B484DRAFT_426792 [Ochromonadaceae sp. CCMP2298]|nr:hypothetical protein B484DRAFT_426792 [Ochromonadaceae sp. CCMP2298]|mmetsp:Transcript_15513/g.34925  ORF Transcript_15513/g.34925 Transcript_15513/m.34925 type:complete len:161 (+) Transcript_15513:158-640(+)|eukprot:CAMPEP_0173175154 /NCGR_PEP_ID=MMETSP1141-20130122/3746_1 /TAXON_ID=483371 /ORGANISM="non described non described, Strain CCMP2298" /LENGTH=160 /DNA_ID=CAMNT_0014097349 /DNA_START=61 /DNA_END=543 /DNA_ORIENTATION=+